MTVSDIVKKSSKLRVYEKRDITDRYGELVFFTKETDQWSGFLAEILGPAVKPQGTAPTRDDMRVAENFGGIRANQVLFKKESGKETVIAMFWPWQDDVHTTLKLAVINAAASGDGGANESGGGLLSKLRFPWSKD